jgi:hypothetical protein
MKTKILLSALAVVLSIGLVTAQEQEQDKKEKATTTQKGPAFVDKDNNGVCDNFEKGTPGNPNANGKQRLLDGSGRGSGQGYGMRNGRGRGARGGRNFVDADNILVFYSPLLPTKVIEKKLIHKFSQRLI